MAPRGAKCNRCHFGIVKNAPSSNQGRRQFNANLCTSIIVPSPLPSVTHRKTVQGNLLAVRRNDSKPKDPRLLRHLALRCAVVARSHRDTAVRALAGFGDGKGDRRRGAVASTVSRCPRRQPFTCQSLRPNRWPRRCVRSGALSNVAESAVITLLGAADRSLLVCAFDTADRRLATIIKK